MIRVDSHFHPNFNWLLPEGFRRWQAGRIWRTFARRKLDAVLVAEHAFRLPRHSFETLQRYRPVGHPTQIFPAVEALSAEGIDMIVFSRNEHVYECADVIAPHRLSIEELVERVRRDPRLHGVIPHPYAPSASGILRHRTEAQARKEFSTLHAVEKFNASLLPLRAVLSSLHMTRLCRRFMKTLNATVTLPAHATPDGITFLGGSDAHHTWDIGSCLLIHTDRPAGENALFAALLSPSFARTFHWEPPHIPAPLSILIDGWTAFREHWMRKWRLYEIEPPLMARATE